MQKVIAEMTIIRKAPPSPVTTPSQYDLYNEEESYELIVRAAREKQEVEIGIPGQPRASLCLKTERKAHAKAAHYPPEPRANRSEGAASHLPGPSSHQVGVGPLERHRPRITAQDADDPRG
ncbi:hypothetical protein E2320_011484 [Naja naja]|nr:hypothetical protein E2320_011484 [Naja naja]